MRRPFSVATVQRATSSLSSCYRLPRRKLRHPPDIRGGALRADSPHDFDTPARSSATDRDARKIPSWRTHHVRQKTHFVICASILCHLGGGAACAGRRKRALGLRNPGANIPIGTANRKHRSAAHRQHHSAADRLNRTFDCAGIESDKSEHTWDATFLAESE